MHKYVCQRPHPWVGVWIQDSPYSQWIVIWCTNLTCSTALIKYPKLQYFPYTTRNERKYSSMHQKLQSFISIQATSSGMRKTPQWCLGPQLPLSSADNRHCPQVHKSRNDWYPRAALQRWALKDVVCAAGPATIMCALRPAPSFVSMSTCSSTHIQALCTP